MVQRHPIQPRVKETWSYRLTVVVIRPLWSLRVELTAALLVLTAASWLDDHLGVWGLLLLPSIAGLLFVPKFARGRRVLVSVFRRARIRRRWESAVRHAGLATLNDRIPVIRKVTPTVAGELLKVRVPTGGTVSDLEECAEAVAACLGVRDVTVTRDRSSARHATVGVVRRDPFDQLGSLAWPHEAATRLSVWDPVPVGVDEHGRQVSVNLPERNVLIGGEPGGGKSVAQSMLVASAALDPDCDLTLLDGKQVELAPWRESASAVVGPDIAAAVDVVEVLRREMDHRYEQLLANGRRKVEPGDGMRLQLVVVDELAYFLTMGERKETTAFATALRDLVSRGRAAGIIVVAATQKPSHEIVPTALRDLFAIRWALRCTTPQASDTVLGSGWVGMGYSAATIDPATKGVGLLLAEGGLPIRCRTFFLDDPTLTRLADRAAALRADRGNGSVTDLRESA